MEYIVVLVSSYFRYLASAPKVHWQAGAEAPALEQEPKPPRANRIDSRCSAPGAVGTVLLVPDATKAEPSRPSSLQSSPRRPRRLQAWETTLPASLS
jgi:hypothetical protein